MWYMIFFVHSYMTHTLANRWHSVASFSTQIFHMYNAQSDNWKKKCFQFSTNSSWVIYFHCWKKNESKVGDKKNRCRNAKKWINNKKYRQKRRIRICKILNRINYRRRRRSKDVDGCRRMLSISIRQRKVQRQKQQQQ